MGNQGQEANFVFADSGISLPHHPNGIVPEMPFPAHEHFMLTSGSGGRPKANHLRKPEEGFGIDRSLTSVLAVSLTSAGHTGLFPVHPIDRLEPFR